MGAILSAYREMNCPLFIRIAGKVFRLVVRLAWIVYQGWLLQGGEEWGSCSSTLQDWQDWEVYWLDCESSASFWQPLSFCCFRNWTACVTGTMLKRMSLFSNASQIISTSFWTAIRGANCISGMVVVPSSLQRYNLSYNICLRIDFRSWSSGQFP